MAWLLLWGTTSFSHLEQADYLGRPGTASLIYYYYDMKCFIIFSGLNIQVYVISYTRHKHTHPRARAILGCSHSVGAHYRHF